MRKATKKAYEASIADTDDQGQLRAIYKAMLDEEDDVDRDDLIRMVKAKLTIRSPLPDHNRFVWQPGDIVMVKRGEE